MIISNFPILPDSIFNALAILGALAAAVYIASGREDNVREIAVEKSRSSHELSDYYNAAANGDPDDRDYWVETAEMFEVDDEHRKRTNSD